MKTLGIIGGIAPESTIAYYRAILKEYKQRVTDGSQPPVIINSIDMMKMLGMIGAGKLDEVTAYLTAEATKLKQAGAEFGIYASNTPHIVFDRLRRVSPFPLISIVECAVSEAKRSGLKRLGLLGTRFTMNASFYADAFALEGLALLSPRSQDLDLVHDKYMGELVEGKFLPETRDAVFAVIDRMIESERIDGVILGGTELPLLLKAERHNGIPLLDTGLIHAKAAVDVMLD